MTFVGRDNEAAPKLAGVCMHVLASVSRELLRDAIEWQEIRRVVSQMPAPDANDVRVLLLMAPLTPSVARYHDCGLVHSDLSEYNLLYDRGDLVVIDLSHGIGRYGRDASCLRSLNMNCFVLIVRSDNANAATFLRDDCINVTRFFARRGYGDAFFLSCYETLCANLVHARCHLAWRLSSSFANSMTTIDSCALKMVCDAVCGEMFG
jgi:serine/threonine-protein kinase RIO1